MGLAWPIEHVGRDRVAQAKRDDDGGSNFKSKTTHGERSGLMRAPWGARLTLGNEFRVSVDTQLASDSAQLGNVTLAHSAANARADNARCHFGQAMRDGSARGVYFAGLDLSHGRLLQVDARVSRAELDCKGFCDSVQAVYERLPIATMSERGGGMVYARIVRGPAVASTAYRGMGRMAYGERLF